MYVNKAVFFITIAILCCQRVFELFLARSNEKWMRRNNAIEFGSQHYPWIVILHVGFILSLSIEGWLREPQLILGWPVVILLIGALQILRYWCIVSLGKFWNTKILVIPGLEKVRVGPYRLMPHPNYVVVILEFLFWPLLFSCWLTMIWAGVANALTLTVRIREENKALAHLV
jgi:methyltransferase